MFQSVVPMFRASLIIVTFLLIGNSTFGQQSPQAITEGVLTYDINKEVPGESMPDDKNFSPKINVTFKDDRSMMQFEGAPELDGNMIMLDGKKQESHLGMKKDGKKYHVVITEEIMKKRTKRHSQKYRAGKNIVRFTIDHSLFTTYHN